MKFSVHDEPEKKMNADMKTDEDKALELVAAANVARELGADEYESAARYGADEEECRSRADERAAEAFEELTK